MKINVESTLRTDLQKAQEETVAAEERFSLLVESVKEYAIFLIDPEGVIMSWNAGAERINGYKSDEIIGRKFTIFYTKEDLERNHPQNELHLALKNGKYEEEGWRVRKDGSHFWSNVVITPLFDKGRRHIGFAKVTRDLSEKKRADDLLKMAYAELEKRVEERTAELVSTNQKLKEAVQTRDEFLSIASHELRTPLTPLKLQIQNFVSQIKRNKLQELPEERLLKMAETCERALMRFAALIENLLDVSRINAGKLNLHLEMIDLKAMGDDLMERFRHEIQNSGCEVTFSASENISGQFDRIRLEQIFLNLLTNALKYGNRMPVEISLTKEGGKAILRFKDRGLGISPKDLERIFQRFERVSENTNVAGLGLGLFITKQIVEAHRGNISVTSTPGEGSVFTVSLPLTA